jgi:hypothetical protein
MGFFGESFDDPRTQGILQAAAAMLGSRGQNFGQSLGSGLQAGLGGYNDAQKMQAAMLMKKAEDEQRRRMQESQIAENESQAKAREFAQAQAVDNKQFFNNVFNPQSGQPQAQQPTPSMQPNTDNAYSVPLDGQQQAQPMQQPATQQQAQRTLRDLTPDQIAQLKMRGVDLTDVYKIAQEGTKISAGDYYRNPYTGEMKQYPKVGEGMAVGSDGVTRPAAGYVEGNARIKGSEAGAIEAAKSGYQIEEFYDPATGQMVKGRKADVLNQAQGGRPLASGPRAADTAYNVEGAKSAAEIRKGIQTAGYTAPGKIAKYERMGQLLKDYEGGKLSGVGMDLAQIGNSLGLKIDKNLSNKEAAKGLSIELANSMREAGTGIMTDKDFENFLAATPQLGQSAAGRQTIINTYIGKLKRDQSVAKMAAQYEKRWGRIDAADPSGRNFEDYLGEYYAKNPVYGK